MVRSLTQISGQLFWHLIMKIYRISWLLALGVPPKSLGNFFYVPFRERDFCRLTFLKGEKSTLSNMVILYIIGMQILYWFKNTTEPMSENWYLSQYVARLPSKISWFITRGKDMTSPIGTYPSPVQQVWLFATISSTNSTQNNTLNTQYQLKLCAVSNLGISWAIF